MSNYITQLCESVIPYLDPKLDTALQESIPRLLNEGTTAMTARCALACSQALPVKPQGVWARGIEAWAGHVTAETGVAEVAVFGALQPNGFSY